VAEVEKDNKKQIMLRVWLVFIGFFIFGIAIVGQIIRIQFVQGQYWRSKQDSLTTDIRTIEASRGNIFSADGSLLATSVPIYEVRMDTKAEGLTDKVFNEGVDSLALGLAGLFNDRPKAEYKQGLKEARRDGARYYLVHRNVSYVDLQKMKKFPLFRMGRNKGGLMTEQRNERELPFKQLASRTIGEYRDVKPVGIEASFDSDLKGISGRRLMQRIAGGVWMPMNDDEEVEPRDGNDLVTTIDINIQDVAESALHENLIKQNADHGCVVLMEVATGEVKAIANLSRSKGGDYVEDFNYVVGEATEPGSTMKLASLLVAMDDGLLELTDQVDLGNGECFYSGRRMKDSHPPKKPIYTALECFMKSSNVGVSKLIYQRYADKPQQFIDGLKRFHLNEKLGLEIPGEGQPFIRDTKDKYWSNLSLPWTSIGYECHLTPLQILTLYNAVANDGKMVKPKFVKEILNHGQIVKAYPTEIIADKIVKESTIAKARKMMEAVVDSGTGRNVKNPYYKVAGKTGTAQIAHSRYGYSKGSSTYQASFVGYFPADNPKYSCMVVVYAPSSDVYYGGDVAAPIFREIADKVYSTHADMHDALAKNDSVKNAMPFIKAGQQKELNKVLAKLNISAASENKDAAWVSVSNENNTLQITERKISNGVVPDVAGMGLRDAIYLLENEGLKVQIYGRGVVTKQSLTPGTAIQKGQQIVIELS
jgi:cell division protein FtsI (penicillin-binding protein 3)